MHIIPRELIRFPQIWDVWKNMKNTPKNRVMLEADDLSPFRIA